MALEVRKFAVSVPAGTAKVNPIAANLNFPPRQVVGLEIVIPPGPRGLMGFQIAQAGRQIFPTTPGEFFVSDDEKIAWPIEGANTSGAWQVIAYNTGNYAHGLEVRFLCSLPGAQAAQAAGSVPLEPVVPLTSSDLPPATIDQAPIPALDLPPPPTAPPPGVPLAPTPPSIPGPQAPGLPALPPPPPLPPLPNLNPPSTPLPASGGQDPPHSATLPQQSAEAQTAALIAQLEALSNVAHRQALTDTSEPAPPTPRFLPFL